MNRPSANTALTRLLAVTIVLASLAGTRGQGTITFNAAASFSGTDYYELGMWFHTVIPPGETNHDGMAGVPGGGVYANLPYNSTAYLIFLRQYSPGDYVSLSLTNGSAFGLTSVQLADPNSPSLSPVPISFVGYLLGGSTVTNTFTTPGNGATNLLNYSFNSDFASGLTSVDILAPRWAMDNLVFVVPEPSTLSLAILALCFALALRRGSLRKMK